MLYDVHEDHSRWKNFRTSIGLFLSRPVFSARVKLKLLGKKYDATTNKRGKFEFKLEIDEELEAGWHSYELELSDKKTHHEGGKLLSVNPNAAHLIVSDIDDTILISHAVTFFKKLRLILFKNAKTRLPFPGVLDLYHSLSGSEQLNPIFFVSSSEWNLYDFLVDFFRSNDIPEGILLLRQYKKSLIDLMFSGGGNHNAKADWIEEIMAMIPEIKLILLGDSGQKDAKLYTDLALRYPDRIKAIIIRYVKGNNHPRVLEGYKNVLRSKGIDFFYINSSEDALKQLEINNYISVR